MDLGSCLNDFEDSTLIDDFRPFCLEWSTQPARAVPLNTPRGLSNGDLWGWKNTHEDVYLFTPSVVDPPQVFNVPCKISK